MAFSPTSDLLDAENAGVRFFEVEDSLGSRSLVRRQLTVVDSDMLASFIEGDWIMPDPSNINQYIPANTIPPGGVAYVVASLVGNQPDVLESGGVTGLAGSYVGRTKVFDTVVDTSYAPGDLLTAKSVDFGGSANRPGLAKDGALDANAVARVEFYDAANGVLVFTALPR